MDFVLSQTFPASHVESSLITPVGVSYREHWADESVLSLDFQILAKHFGLFYKIISTILSERILLKLQRNSSTLIDFM